MDDDEGPLLSKLTRERDENGSTPLHLAASLGGLPYKEFVSDALDAFGVFSVYGKRPSGNSTVLLLKVDMCPVYQPDNQGLYPIHVAAWADRVDVVELLLTRCPDCATLRDRQGRTFLHIAVERKRIEIVRFASWKKESEFSSILNLQDNNGDTALHRSVQVGHLDIFRLLVLNQHVRLDVPNKEGLTPRDVWWTSTPNTFHYAWVCARNTRITIFSLSL